MSDTSGFSYRPALDGLRAIAVLAVFAYHLDYDWAAGGFLGVDTFFVLSGYLITSLLLTEHGRTRAVSLAGFWSRRAKRLLPAVLLLLAGVAVYATVWAPVTALEQIRGDALATLLYVANWRFIIQDASYFDLFGEASPLRHMWSLAIEEQFYLLWPLSVVGLLRLGRGRLGPLVGVTAAGVLVSVALMAALYDPIDPSRAYFGTGTRAHSLLIGALLGVALLNGVRAARTNRVLQGAGLVAAVVLVWSFARVSDTGAAYYRGGSLAFSVAVAVVVAAVVQTGRSPLERVLAPAALRWIGQISYGLYLWHWPMIVWLNRGRTGLEGWPLDALRIAATFTVATASFYLLERPIRYGTIGRRQVAIAAPLAMAVVGVMLVVSTTGAEPSRFDTAVDFTIPPVEDAGAPPETSAAGEAADDAPPGTGIDAPDLDTVPSGNDPAPRPLRKVALIGDSVADTISEGLGPAIEAQGIDFVSVAFPGCGIAAGFMLDDDGQPFEWSQACFENVPRTQEELITTHDPDIVVWHSTWELAQREVDGEVVVAGDERHRAALLADVEAAVERLGSSGARVVFVLAVPNAESDTAAADEDTAGRFASYNDVLRAVARERPNATAVIDLGEIVCPDGPPCPTTIEGLRLRPDGGHYTIETSDWVAAWLAPQVIAAGN